MTDNPSNITLELEALSIFNNLPEPALQRLSAVQELMHFNAGEEIDTPAGLVLLITHGEVSCFIHDAAEKKFLLGTAGQGEVLGELSYLVGEGAHEQKVVLQALSDVSAIAVPADAFFEVVTGNPQACLTLLRGISLRLAAMNRFAKSVVDVDISSIDLPANTFGEKMADWISAKIGSWQFLFAGVLFTALWMALNAWVLLSGWDPYPFIFLNLVFSVISAATLPVLLMSQNRQNQLDRMAARVNQRMTLRATQLNARILKELRSLRHKLLEENAVLRQ